MLIIQPSGTKAIAIEQTQNFYTKLYDMNVSTRNCENSTNISEEIFGNQHGQTLLGYFIATILHIYFSEYCTCFYIGHLLNRYIVLEAEKIYKAVEGSFHQTYAFCTETLLLTKTGILAS